MMDIQIYSEKQIAASETAQDLIIYVDLIRTLRRDLEIDGV